MSGHGQPQSVGVRSLLSGGGGRQGGGGRLGRGRGRPPGELGGSGDLQGVEVVHSSHVVDGHFSFFSIRTGVTVFYKSFLKQDFRRWSISELFSLPFI